MELDPALAASGVRLLVYETVGSTNSEALTQARAGARGPLWITATRQTAGRGRRSRVFISEAGNLFASLLLSNPCTPERAPELSFVAALALRDAVAECAPDLEPRLWFKWPNDLLCDGEKLAGILVEGESAFEQYFAAVVGIGVNCVHHPTQVSYPATDLAAQGVTIGPDRLFRVLTRSVHTRIHQWNRGAGFPRIRSAWLQRAVGIGERVRVRLTHEDLEGRFETVDDHGLLMLRVANESIRAIAAGDMVLLHFGGGYPPRRSTSPLDRREKPSP